jgi:hypothetical protein
MALLLLPSFNYLGDRLVHHLFAELFGKLTRLPQLDARILPHKLELKLRKSSHRHPYTPKRHVCATIRIYR